MNEFPMANSGRWTTGVCGCFEDWESCCIGFCCPCILLGRYTEILDQGSTSCCAAGTVWSILQLVGGCGCLYSCTTRSRLRRKYGLPPSPCGDFCTDFCCQNLAICQVYRELLNRNVDPSLGYEGVKHIYDKPPSQQDMRR